MGYTLQYIRCAFDGMPRRKDVPRLFTCTPEIRRKIAVCNERYRGFDIVVQTETGAEQSMIPPGVKVRLRLIGCALPRRHRMFVVPSRGDLLKRSWQTFICRVTRFMDRLRVEQGEADTVCVQGGGVISATIAICGLALLQKSKVQVHCISATSGGGWGVFMFNAMKRPVLSNIAKKLQVVLFDMSCDLTRLTLCRAPTSNKTKNWKTFMQTVLRRTMSSKTVAFTNEAALCCYNWADIVDALLTQFSLSWASLSDLGCSDVVLTTCVLRSSDVE